MAPDLEGLVTRLAGATARVASSCARRVASILETRSVTRRGRDTSRNAAARIGCLSNAEIDRL
jgi:hypothetical protein